MNGSYSSSRMSLAKRDLIIIFVTPATVPGSPSYQTSFLWRNFCWSLFSFLITMSLCDLNFVLIFWSFCIKTKGHRKYSILCLYFTLLFDWPKSNTKSPLQIQTQTDYQRTITKGIQSIIYWLTTQTCICILPAANRVLQFVFPALAPGSHSLQKKIPVSLCEPGWQLYYYSKTTL